MPTLQMVIFDDQDDARETLLALREREARIARDSFHQDGVVLEISRRQLDRIRAAILVIQSALGE